MSTGLSPCCPWLGCLSGHVSLSFLSWVVLIQSHSPGSWYLVSSLVTRFCEWNKWFRFRTVGSGQIFFKRNFKVVRWTGEKDKEMKKLSMAENLKWPPRSPASLGLWTWKHYTLENENLYPVGTPSSGFSSEVWIIDGCLNPPFWHSPFLWIYPSRRISIEKSFQTKILIVT